MVNGATIRHSIGETDNGLCKQCKELQWKLVAPRARERAALPGQAPSLSE